jgi:hypothetical protein
MPCTGSIRRLAYTLPIVSHALLPLDRSVPNRCQPLSSTPCTRTLVCACAKVGHLDLAPGADVPCVAAMLRRAACPTTKRAARQRPRKKPSFRHSINRLSCMTSTTGAARMETHGLTTSTVSLVQYIMSNNHSCLLCHHIECIVFSIAHKPLSVHAEEVYSSIVAQLCYYVLVG